MAFRRTFLFFSVMLLTTGLGVAQDRDVAARLAKWKNVEMPFRSAGLTERERQMTNKLVEACRLLDDVYWRQRERRTLRLYPLMTASPFGTLGVRISSPEKLCL